MRKFRLMWRRRSSPSVTARSVGKIAGRYPERNAQGILFDEFIVPGHQQADYSDYDQVAQGNQRDDEHRGEGRLNEAEISAQWAKDDSQGNQDYSCDAS